MLLKQSIIKYKILLYRFLNKNFLKLEKIINNPKKNAFTFQINKNTKNNNFVYIKNCYSKGVF